MLDELSSLRYEGVFGGGWDDSADQNQVAIFRSLTAGLEKDLWAMASAAATRFVRTTDRMGAHIT